MAQPSRPASGQNTDRPTSAAPPRSAPPEIEQFNASPAINGPISILDQSPQSIIEGILGPNKDGRVRNPVPSKLKGKTDQKQGNFGVMSMGQNTGAKKNESVGRDAAAERDAAARRTSENTASRAKAAQQEKYVAPKKRGLDATLNEATRGTNRGSPFARDDKRQARPLAPDETKMEQARLLTLLRSINPITVVDQICKAVAYFGGIPGAPPPEDGIFPESANTRETGALFIGWLAEIFPDLSSKSPDIMKIADGGKKKSRTSKGHQATLSSGGPVVSAEQPNSMNGYGYGPAVSAPAWGLPQNLAEVNPQAPSVPDTSALKNGGTEHIKQSEQQQAPLTPAQPIPAEASHSNVSASASKRRGRGRPKGSTNKKSKDGQPEASGQDQMQDGQQQTSDSHQTVQAQDLAGAAINVLQSGQSDQTNYHPAIIPQAKPAQVPQYSDQSWQNNTQKNHSGQSTAPVQDELSPEERAVLEAFRGQGVESTMDMVINNTAPVPSPILPPKKTQAEGGVKRKRAPAKPKPVQTVPDSTASSGYPSQNSPQVHNQPQQQIQQTQQQIQEQPPQPHQLYQQAQQHEQQVQQQYTPQIQPAEQMQQTQITHKMPNSASLAAISNNDITNMAKDAIQWASIETPIPPPAKKQRQRKPKVPATKPIEPPSRTQSASVVSAVTPTIPPSTIPDSQATSSLSQAASSQQNVPASRPPAEGLEAHYEMFASLTQQNGRSHTPTMPQQQQNQQQHVRQQSKPSIVPPQQATAIISQMQHQKSQQGNQQTVQRSEQKTSQDNVSRPSPVSYYGQRSQNPASYNQQYPSHQASQLYGSTQSASPRLGNSNSYRTTSSHTLAQSGMTQNSMAQSPQFSQAETYRTTSPHIAQPSPSFSQPESNYRTTNQNSLAQASPSFTQTENPYRTPSTHSMARTSSYSSSRSHVQAPSTQQSQSQNHYGQFSDAPYIDLPTLESLGHSGSSSTATLGYGPAGLNVGLGGTNANSTSHSRSSVGSASLYGTSTNGLSAFDQSAQDLLRVSRGTNSSGHTNPHAHSGYGGTNSGMSNTFDNDDMRERLLRGMTRR
ncbi:hypothetical protein HYALB_00001747 [Hymenoscyphus albidus]|uniref:Uncharacterized protein n=1 Tax=Hymenoscyphus albidus TaxID=595503 RepID=A0A9N9LM71_9HELO|nr:hypothetical protein HYALB_00001747 [Hymenoscyphus albidus]